MKSEDRQSGAIAWMAKNGVAANLLMLVFLVGGFIMLGYVKQEIFPEFSMDTVTVSVPYPGASPEEVERGIILAVEEVVQGLDDIKEVRSTAKEGSGTVVIEMTQGGNLQKLANEVKNAVDRITSFPEESEEPRVSISSRKRNVIEFCIYADAGEKEMYELAEALRDELMQVEGVTLVEISGTRKPEISIEIPMENLRRFGISIDEVASRLKAANIELPGGGVKAKGGEILVRVKERRDYGKEFESLPLIATQTGTPLTISDIGTVTDGFEDIDTISLWNGKRAVFFQVYSIGDQTPIGVAQKVEDFIGEYRLKLPDGVNIDISSNMSDMYSQRIDLLVKNGVMGWMLIILLLAMFLEYRLAFWVAMGIPIAFLGTILLMPIVGATMNMMTLFAFIIALGIVVDDAIIVGESVYSLRQRGMSWMRASIDGTKAVAMPVIFSVITNMVAFSPLLFIPGVLGKIYFQIPVIVITAFSVSIIESIFILPAHLAHAGDGSKRNIVLRFMHAHQQAFSFWFKDCVENGYGKFVKNNLIPGRYIATALGVAILLIAVAWPASGRMGMELFPKIESDYAKVTLKLPVGSSFEKTQEYAAGIVRKAQELVAENGADRLSNGLLCLIGQSRGGSSMGGHYADIRIYLTSMGVRPIGTEEVVKKWREKVGELVGIESITFESDAGGPGSGSAMTIQLRHRDIGVLKAAGEDLAAAFAQYPNVKDVGDGYEDGKAQLDFKIKDEGRMLGFTATDIARQLRGAFYGAEASRQLRGREEMKIMARLPEHERRNEATIDNFTFISKSGKAVTLSEIAEVTRGNAYTAIERENGRRVINVTADVSPRSEAPVILKSIEEQFIPGLLEKYPGLSFGYSGRQKDLKESMDALKIGMLFALLVIYAILAVPFKSYTQPLIIMISIPFGIVGAIFGHMLMGYPLSLMSMFGIIALSGVVLNDSLILLDLANQKRSQGMGARDAIAYAATHRLRPVLLTTLTTFFGLAPMIFETSRQARFLIPMALSLGFGILFASVITLLILPSLYTIWDDVKSPFAKAERPEEKTEACG